ncbi:uncharacterized protein FIBRA_07483 [Fibroporia radiculosa]|uniref:Hydrophobin n=1 Tax=Fibroporia radiculosa TaxID=599839 RepID=J4IBU5_9APHY|nr:uncharacterized protein FIBRA_07483 [Fibroporia radiculosa]CCM05271.1 predicted protein [Fibroporia radiculosa]
MLSKSFVLHVLSAFAFSKQVLARPVVVPPHYARAAEVNTATCAVVTVTVSDTAPTSTVAATTTASATAATSTLSSSVIGDFGSCSVPEIEFGTGFGGRTETAFQPVNQTSYNHGSADNIAVITSFICLALTNTCGANALAKSTCATAASAAANCSALRPISLPFLK